MKQILKKELPFAKAGAGLELQGREEKHSYYEYKGYKIIIPNDKLDDWIEEVKPREWYELVYGNGLDQRFKFETKEEAEKYLEDNEDRFIKLEIVKVREVE